MKVTLEWVEKGHLQRRHFQDYKLCSKQTLYRRPDVEQLVLRDESGRLYSLIFWLERKSFLSVLWERVRALFIGLLLGAVAANGVKYGLGKSPKAIFGAGVCERSDKDGLPLLPLSRPPSL